MANTKIYDNRVQMKLEVDKGFKEELTFMAKKKGISRTALIINYCDSAPELLEACIEALKHHQGGHSEIGFKLREAIKKATQ